MFRSLPLLAAAVATAAALPAAPADAPAASPITWKKTVLDTKFRSEGVAVADVNKDGKADVLVGDFWYEAPDWKRHATQKSDKPDGFDPNGYSKVFACWADDLNADGFPDLVVVGFPGEPAYWLENPKGKTAGDADKPLHWAKHVIWPSACNETPVYADLLGTGKKVLVMGAQPPGKGNEGQMAYFTPNPADPKAMWAMHPVSVPSTPAEVKDGKEVPGTRKEIPGTQRFSHGLGVGDVNGDKRADVICTGGWWEQPAAADGKTPWAFHPAPLGPESADLFAYDLDGNGKAAVVGSSAHGYGIWAHRRRGEGFEKVDLFPKLVSQTHAMHCVDINGDGLRDLVTGKRWWAHGPKGDADPAAPAKVYWFEAKQGADGVVTFAPHEIDDDSGIGTQFAVADINGDGKPDVVTSNKKGVRVLVQGGKK